MTTPIGVAGEHPQNETAYAGWRQVIFALVTLSLGAALIHASVMVVHFREYWLFGLFFALVAPLQAGWAYLITRPDPTRRVLTIGAAANLAIAVVWLVSRTVGIPFGPDALEAETVHAPDVIATLDELAIAALAVYLLRRWVPRVEPPGWALGFAWALACASLIAALVGASGPH